MAQPIVRLDQVTKSYRMGAVVVHALHDVNFEVDAGEFVVILGPSGCGKTTLLNLIGGMDSPTSGHVVVDGIDIASYTDAELTRFRREKIGFVFQFFNLVPTLSARENVELAGELVLHPRSSEQVLDAVGLEDRATHFPGELSGGEQQRVAIARAMVKNPAILLCDEPTGGLDSETGRRILSVLHEISKAEGRTVLLVTHNTVLAQMADQVVQMQNGRLSASEHNAAPMDPDELRW
jgi:putative ABC transport system ATP-binding protein